jgi:Yip1 domain
MSLQTRVVAILTKPAEEWRMIASEPATVEGLMRDYAAPLAAIPAVAQFIGFTLLGMTVPVFGDAVRFGVVRSFVNAVVSWVFALVGAWIAAVAIEKLAPTFQSRGNTAQALKLVVYSMTAIWVAGVLYLVPALSPLVILAVLYTIYLCYLGFPPVMGTPSDRVVPYMVVSVLVTIVVVFCLGVIATMLLGIGAYRSI